MSSITQVDDPSKFEDQPMLIEDAASILRRKIAKNEKPYESYVMTQNNDLVDTWKKNMLLRMSVDGRVRASLIMRAFNVFIEGREIYKLIETDQSLVSHDEARILKIKDILENASIEELYTKYGHCLVTVMYTDMINYIRRWIALEKWNKIYSQSTDCLDWFKLSDKHSNLMNGLVLPFLSEEKLKDIREKITPLSIRIEPAQASGIRRM